MVVVEVAAACPHVSVVLDRVDIAIPPPCPPPSSRTARSRWRRPTSTQDPWIEHAEIDRSAPRRGGPEQTLELVVEPKRHHQVDLVRADGAVLDDDPLFLDPRGFDLAQGLAGAMPTLIASSKLAGDGASISVTRAAELSMVVLPIG